MGFALVTFLIFTTLLAAFTRDSFIFSLIYLVAGAYLAGSWWNSQVLKSVGVEREFIDHAFPGDSVAVKLKIKNKSRLPAIWLHAQELLPLDIARTRNIHEVVSLPGHGSTEIEYSLSPQRRGYYPIGPFRYSSGDLLGLSYEKEVQNPVDFLTVYPQVFPLSTVRLPSHSPLGSLKHDQPIFEDTSRPIGKRDYQSGDSLRRIDWKATANVGRLQVKQFEPSIALETIIFLNLNANEYYYKSRYSATELGISVAASLASWIVSQKQSVGLVTNGKDQLALEPVIQTLPARKGRAHLMRLFETLARVEAVETIPLAQLLHEQRFGLSWGTSLILISSQVDTPLFDEIFQARKKGLDTVLILCGEIVNLQEIKNRARQFHIPLFILYDEQDIKIWQIPPMNQRLLKLFDNNQRVITLTLDFLVTLMMVCLAIALANLGARFYPGWNGAYFPVVAWFISVKSLISWNKIRDKEYHEKLIYHLAEWVIIAVFLKALIYIQTSPEQLWIDLVRWQQNIFTFFEGEFLFIFCSLFLMWLFCTNLAGDLANLHTELSDFHWELGQLENDRQSTRLRLAQKVFNSGLVLIITTLLTRADLRQVFGESPASQASTANVLAFFLFALIFFSLTQYAMLHGRWFWNKTPISPQIGKNWIRYSVIFLLLIVVIAFLLPTRYTYGLLEVIQTGISILLAIALFLINLVIFPFLLLFSLLGGKKPTGPTLPQLNIPEITPPGVEAAPALWWEFTKSIFFWVAFLGIIGFAFWYYLRQNPTLLQSIRKFPGLRILFSIFSSFFNWVKGINNQIANTISQNMERLRKRVNQSSLRQASRWFDFRRLSPRQKVMYYYLKMIDHSAESGWKRAPYQTPAQFEHDLKKGLPDVEQEVEGITAQFVEARYSQHPIPEDRTNLVQLFWRKIIRALRSSSSRKKPKPPQA